MKTVWARVGMSIYMTDKDYERFVNCLRAGKEKEAQLIFWDCYCDCHELVGETYVPNSMDELGIGTEYPDDLFIMSEA